MSGPGRAKVFYGYILVFSGFVMMLCMYGTLYSFGVFLKPLLAELHSPGASVSGAYSLCFFLSGALAMAAGRLTDRIGPRPVISCAGGLIASGYLLLSRVETIAGLYLYYGLIVGIGMSGSLTPVLSTIARWFEERRGIMTGLVVSGVGTGTLIAPPFADRLISAYGWRTSFFLLGMTVLVVVVGSAQLFLRHPSAGGLAPFGSDRGGARRDIMSAGLSLRDACRTTRLWILFALYGCAGFVIQVALVNSTSYAISLGASPALGAMVLSVTGVGGLAGRVFGGSASDRFGTRRIIIASTAIMVIQFSLLLPADRMWTVFVCAGLFGLAYGEILCMMPLLPAELFGLKSHGAIMGIITFGSTIGGGMGPVAAGALLDGFGDYRVIWMACTAVSVIALILAVRVTKPARKPEPGAAAPVGPMEGEAKVSW